MSCLNILSDILLFCPREKIGMSAAQQCWQIMLSRAIYNIGCDHSNLQ